MDGPYFILSEGSQTEKEKYLCLGPGRSVPLQGQQGYRGRIPVSPGGSRLVLSGSKGLHYPLESGRVTLGAQ